MLRILEKSGPWKFIRMAASIVQQPPHQFDYSVFEWCASHEEGDKLKEGVDMIALLFHFSKYMVCLCTVAIKMHNIATAQI